MLKNSNFKGKLFIIAAPSGAGKTSVMLRAINLLQNLIPISKVITFTTRKYRVGEIPGQDYNFLSIKKFLSLEKEGYFLETTEYNRNYYGSPASIVPDLKAGKSLIMVTDHAGAKNFKNNILPDVVTIWLTVPSIEVLRQRLEKRGTENKDDINKRLEIAKQEIDLEESEHLFKYHVLNDDLEISVKNVVNIIQQELGIIP